MSRGIDIPPMSRDLTGLSALLSPASIAVIGASDAPGRVGGMPIAFLTAVGYPGDIYPVNPTRSSVQGRAAYPSIAAVGQPVDLAVVAVAADRVVDVVEECAASGVRGAIVFSAGFAETGPVGEARQRVLADVATRTGIRICGPNCAGIMSVHGRMTASFGSHLAADTTLVPGSIAIVSQSGAVGAYMFTLARERGIGLSYWVTTGNEADTQVADYVAAIAEDPQTDVIALYVEQVRDADALISACARAGARGKRLVGVLAGRSQAAEQALRSHTAAMAGDRHVTAAALEELGIVLVDRIDGLLSTSIGLTGRRVPRGSGVGIVTISGAAGIMMVDRCVDLGLEVPALPADTQAHMKELLPYAGTANPVDVTGNISNTPEIFAPFLEALLACDDVGSIVCFLGHVLLSPHVGSLLLDEVIAIAARTEKPITLVGVVPTTRDRDRLAAAEIPRFTDPVVAIDALGAAVRTAARATSPAAGIADLRRTTSPPAVRLALPQRDILSEEAAQSCLARFGVRFPEQAIARTAHDAESAVGSLDGPAVLKILSADITHKTDVGGVRVGVTAEDAGAVFTEIVESARAHVPNAEIDGVLVQELVDGFPVIVGTTCDETFGPVVLVGSGGIYAELLGDRAIALAPVDRAAAESLIDRTRLPAILAGARGGPPLARDALVDLIVTISELAWSFRDELQSVELNPVLLRPVDAVAVDALIQTKGRQHGS
jgi:acyl-CoA synthetase (NDP forming)